MGGHDDPSTKQGSKVRVITMDQNQLEQIQQRAAEILADIIGRQYGLEIKVHVERTDNNG